MRHIYLVINLVIIITLFLLTACTKSITLDDSRQIAVNKILTDDHYTENDGYNFRELSAEKTGCDTCFKFVYSFNQDYMPEIKGYVVDVEMKDGAVQNIKYTEILSANFDSATILSDNLPAIEDRFDTTCENKCGNGYCDDVVCQDFGCVCEESKINCPEDC